MFVLCIVNHKVLVASFLQNLDTLGIEYKVVKEYLGQQIELIMTEEEINLMRLIGVPAQVILPGEKIKLAEGESPSVYMPQMFDFSFPFARHDREYVHQFRHLWAL